MKKITLIIFSLLLLKVSGQATLPATWDFSNTTTPPTGWSLLNSNGGALTYTAAGFFGATSPAGRLDAAGEYVQLYFADKPSTCEILARHTGASGNFNGKFSIIQSADGSTWDTIKTWTTDMPGSMTKLTVNLKPSSKYVRWVMTVKGSGYNVSVDDVVVNKASASSKPEIEIYSKSSKARILNNIELFVGNTTPYTLKIKNKALTDTLKISSISFAGADASFFSTNVSALIVGPADSTEMNLILANTGATGSKKATLTILSNDSSGNSKIDVPVYAVNGTKASSPANTISTLQVTDNKAWRLKVKWTATDAEQYMVLVSPNLNTNSINDNVTYEKGAYINDSRIVYIGGAGEITLDKIVANTTYNIKVIPFNGKLGFENYEHTLGQEINATTPGLNPGTYYNGISTANATFVGDLKAKVRPHFQVFYSNYPTTIITNVENYDTTAGKKVVECYYTGYKHVYTPPFAFDVLSREHAYPYSWMGEASQDSANYSDLHMLFPVHQDNANSIRSNYPLNNLKTVTFTFLGGRLGTDSNGVLSYEPRDEVKGTIARANFYVCATYNGAVKKFTIPAASQFITEKQDQYVLKRWNAKFPPTKKEIARHEYIASVQNNRNPFIDNPGWACFIDFNTVAYLASGDCTKGLVNKTVSADKIIKLNVFPNPSNSMLNVDLNAFNSKETKTIELFDISERTVLKTNTNEVSTTLNISELPAGTYLLRVSNKLESGFFTVVKN